MPGVTTSSTVHRTGSRLPCNACFPYVVRTRVHVSQPLWIELPYTGDVSLHHVLKARPQVRQQVAPVTEGGEGNVQRGGHHTTNCTPNKRHITTQKCLYYYLAIGRVCSGCHGFRIPVVKVLLPALCSISTHLSSAATSLLAMMSWKRTHTCTQRRRPMAS